MLILKTEPVGSSILPLATKFAALRFAQNANKPYEY